MAPILTIWLKEIVDNLRDRRTLITSLVVPVFLMPAILIGTIKLQASQQKSAEKKIAKIAIINATDAPTLVNFLQHDAKIIIVNVPSDQKAAIDAGSVNVVLSVPAEFETNLKQGLPSEIAMAQKSSNYDSSNAVIKVLADFQAFNQLQSAETLAKVHIPTTALTSIIPTTTDLTSSAELGGYIMGFLLPMFIVLFAIIGGMYIAIDVSAGEKERKTLEALLVTPVSRLNIVAGKFLAVASTATVTIILSMVSLYASFKLVPLSDIGLGSALSINVTASAIFTMLGIGVILAIMFSGLLLSVSIFAKSYKEAQNYITPFYLLAILPVSLLNSIPGFKPTLPFFLIPGVNAVFVMKEVLVNVYDLKHILVTIASLLVMATIGILAAGKIYSQEGILFRD